MRRATRAAALAAAALAATACSPGQRTADSTAPPPPAPPSTAETASSTTHGSSTVDADAMAGFAISDGHRAALEAAGLGALLHVEYPTQPADVPWPTTAWPTGPLPDGVDAAAVQAIIDEAFRPNTDEAGNETGRVDALLAVSGGRLVVDAYNGWNPAEPHPSWSMAKSVTHALLGVLVAEGRLDPYSGAPVPEWSDPADARHAITVDDLLRMRSGLAWDEEYSGASDVIAMLYGEGRADRAHYAASMPLRVTPGTTFAYSTGTSMILARMIGDIVGRGETGTAWARSALFDRLGITSVTHDLDGAGVMSGGSKIDMSPQDFARFGLLYLRGGRWDGQQIVPRAWVDHARLPRPDAPEYGAHWWVDVTDHGRLSFAADGFAGQLLIVVPSLDLVVVALANTQDGRSDAAAWALVDAFDTRR